MCFPAMTSAAGTDSPSLPRKELLDDDEVARATKALGTLCRMVYFHMLLRRSLRGRRAE
jgi:Arc/MetJ family transcription regulator